MRGLRNRFESCPWVQFLLVLSHTDSTKLMNQYLLQLHKIEGCCYLGSYALLRGVFPSCIARTDIRWRAFLLHANMISWPSSPRIEFWSLRSLEGRDPYPIFGIYINRPLERLLFWYGMVPMQKGPEKGSIVHTPSQISRTKKIKINWLTEPSVWKAYSNDELFHFIFCQKDAKWKAVFGSNTLGLKETKT